MEYPDLHYELNNLYYRRYNPRLGVWIPEYTNYLRLLKGKVKAIKDLIRFYETLINFDPDEIYWKDRLLYSKNLYQKLEKEIMFYAII